MNLLKLKHPPIFSWSTCVFNVRWIIVDNIIYWVSTDPCYHGDLNAYHGYDIWFISTSNILTLVNHSHRDLR